MDHHDIDMPSLRTRIERDPYTGKIVRCTASLKCTCGVEVSTSAANLAQAEKQVSDLICDHIEQADRQKRRLPAVSFY